MQTQDLNTTIEQLISPLTVSFEFVPYSQIQGTDRELLYDGKPIHATHYNVIFKDGDRELWRTRYAMGDGFPGSKISPKLTDVIRCLLLDADVLDYASFEDWAYDLGFDWESRSAEKTYKQCLDQAESLRNLLGDDTLDELRELLSDY